MELKKKISAKTVLGKVKALFPKNDKGEIIEGAQLSLMRVLGVCTGIKTGTSTYGEWVGFKGQFKAKRLSDGVEFLGSELYVPEVVTEIVAPIVREANGGTVDFAFDIGAIATDTEVGYEYTVTPLFEVKQSDPLTDLESRVMLLSASKAEEKPAEPAAQGKGKK